MTVFQLFVYSCVTLNGWDGELISKMCRWDARDLHQTETKCAVAGANELGHPVYSDIAEDRRVEKMRCLPIGVR